MPCKQERDEILAHGRTEIDRLAKELIAARVELYGSQDGSVVGVQAELTRLKGALTYLTTRPGAIPTIEGDERYSAGWNNAYFNIANYAREVLKATP